MISNELSLIQQNETLRNSLASAVEEFLAAGGQIDVRQITVSKGISVIERIQPPNFQSSSIKSQSDAQARRIRELAKTLNRDEICERESISLGVLRGIAKRYGIQFLAGPKKSYAPNKLKPKQDAELVEKIKDCMARGITRYQACKELEISSTLIRRVIADYNIDYPVVTR